MAPKIEIVTGPEVEPVTAAEVRLHTHISHTEEDAIINRWITAGRRLAEGYQQRAYITQTLRASFDEWPSFPLELPYSPLQSVTSVTYYDQEGNSAAFSTDDLIVDTSSEPGRIDLAYGVSLPSTSLQSIDAVKIVYVVGHGETAASVPAEVCDAILLYCAWRYENRTAETGAPRAFYDMLYAGDIRF